MSTLHAFCALALLVSASLLAKTTTIFDSKKVCKGLKDISSDARCFQLIIGVVSICNKGLTKMLVVNCTTFYDISWNNLCQALVVSKTPENWDGYSRFSYT